MNNVTDHLMVDVRTSIALASKIYIIDLDANELYFGDEKVLDDFVDDH